jgi:hypothetical protein
MLQKQVFQWCNERPPDPNAPLDCYADSNGRLCAFVTQRDTLGSLDGVLDSRDLAAGAVVPTVSVQVISTCNAVL